MIKTGLFASINRDRIYTEQDYKLPFTMFFTNGIRGLDSTNLQVVADENMGLKIKPGYAMIDGYSFKLTDEEYPITLEDADGVYDRIDRVVLRLDYIEREMRLLCIPGEPSDTPIAPPKVREENTIYDLSLATVFVGAGVTAITQANITDNRLLDDECGKIRLADEDMTFDTIAIQYQSQWAEIMEQISDFGIPLMGVDTVGGAKYDPDTLNMSDGGVLSVPMASATQQGGIKIGGGVDIDDDGVMSALVQSIGGGLLLENGELSANVTGDIRLLVGSMTLNKASGLLSGSINFGTQYAGKKVFGFLYANVKRTYNNMGVQNTSSEYHYVNANGSWTNGGILPTINGLSVVTLDNTGKYSFSKHVGTTEYSITDHLFALIAI